MINLEIIDSKKEVFQDFFEWLYDDNRITNKIVELHSEIDLSLCHTYSDSNIYYPIQFEFFFETKVMSKLGRISQLGLLVNHFSNLYHNRLEHSKGVLNKKIEELFYNYQIIQIKVMIGQINNLSFIYVLHTFHIYNIKAFLKKK